MKMKTKPEKETDIEFVNEQGLRYYRTGGIYHEQ